MTTREEYEAHIAKQGMELLAALGEKIDAMGGADPNAQLGVALRLLAIVMAEGNVTSEFIVTTVREQLPRLYEDMTATEQALKRPN